MAALLYFLILGSCTLLAYTVAPSATVLNQLLAVLGWGLLILYRALGSSDSPQGSIRFLEWALIGCGGAAALTLLAADGTPSTVVPPLVTLLGAWCVLSAGAAASREGAALRPLLAAFVLIGCADLALAVVQVFLPTLPDGTWIARSGLPGRAVGNLRQPNHLSSLTLWSAIAVVPLMESWKERRWIGSVLMALFVFTVELTASRTGMIGIVLLALWGAVDRRLHKVTRLTLLATPVVYGIVWLGMSLWSSETHHTFGAAARLAEHDISGSRYGIWANTLELIRRYPWFGVGFGEFNFAWTLTPFPHRPTAFFDHTHNIVLQLLVEFGIPLGGLVLLLLGIALWQAFRRAWGVQGPEGVGFRAAFMMVLMIALHSQLEYPLWYAYFLLPTAWAWGYCLGAKPAKARRDGVQPDASVWRHVMLLGGVAMIVGSLWAFKDYMVVSRIFEPGDDDKPLAERISAGERSIFFGHHAAYAAATVPEHPSEAWPAFGVATHYLLDTRLMMAWAKGFAERGDLDRARYLAQRLREFHKPEAEAFFAPCDAAAQEPTTKSRAGQKKPPLPWQCEAPTRDVDWQEFRDPALYRVPQPSAR